MKELLTNSFAASHGGDPHATHLSDSSIGGFQMSVGYADGLFVEKSNKEFVVRKMQVFCKLLPIRFRLVLNLPNCLGKRLRCIPKRPSS